MALPPHFLDELRSRLTLSEVVGRKVTWDRRKSNPARGDWWAPCPFHQEKTPSFHADDTKGFYYCFGCHAKGDAITFVKEIENLSFMEAVDRLAAEAGLEMPREREAPGAAAARDRRAILLEVMEQALAAFRRALRSGAGAEARAYAASRGLTEDWLSRFEIGFAPEARGHLAALFRDKGQSAEAVDAGLLIAPEDGGAPFDRFRNRLIFPIRDPRGRCIAFGGRALSRDAKAKYLNSPETELFHKGRTLYNHAPGREAARREGRLVVAEGYMDVIALARAGIDAAVAPLGTAITADQLGLLWKIHPEPVIALDGDAAGLRAAERLIDLALPLIGPERRLGFALMPDGQDPDDLLRAGGPEAVAAVLAEPDPLIALIWRREVGAHALDTPERRAALKSRLEALVRRIAEPDLARLYRESFARRLREHFWELDRPVRGVRGPRRAPEGASAPTRASPLARGADAEAIARAREAVILLVAWRNRAAAAALEDALEAMPLTHAPFEGLRARLLSASEAGAAPDEADLDALLAEPQARTHPLARPGADPERVRLVLAEAIARHTALCARAAELADAARDLDEAEGEDWTWRLRQAGTSCHSLEAGALNAEDDAARSRRKSRVAELLERHGGSAAVVKKTDVPPSNQ